MEIVKNNFKERKYNIVSINESLSINKETNMELNEIPNLVCTFEKNNRIHSMDFGSLCFTRKKINKYNQKENVVYLVDPISYKPDRILGIKFFLEEYLGNGKSLSSIKSNFKKLQRVINHLNENFPEYDFSSIDDAQNVYIKYSKYLVNKINIKKASSESISTESYKALQDILAKFLSACTKSNIHDFYSLIRRIESIRVIQPIKLENNENSFNRKIKILLEIFNTISDHITNEKPLPCIVNTSAYDLKQFYIDVALSNKSNKIFLDFFYNNNQIIPFEIFNQKIEEYYNSYPPVIRSKFKSEMRAYYRNKIKKIDELNTKSFLKIEPKIAMANFCMVAFAKLLISVTGANESVIYDLGVDSFKTISNEKGKRALNIKDRAGGKQVVLEFGLKFQNYFEQYLKFRRKLNILCEDTLPNEYKNYLFIKIPINRKSGYNKYMKLDSTCFEKFSATYKNLFGESVVTNKELRANVAKVYFNQTNSSITTAIKLSNTPSVANKSYSNINFDDLASQFNNYFNEFNKKTLLIGRNHEEIIPVKVNAITAIDTNIGNCSKPSPRKIEGFNKTLPPLTCGNPKSCLYCENYVINLNETDIRKILSLKFILEYNSQIKDEQQRVIFRINEIMNYITQISPSIKSTINQISEEVEEGFLDDYWNNHLTMLLSLEEAHYD
jgi:hypothetical protein